MYNRACGMHFHILPWLQGSDGGTNRANFTDLGITTSFVCFTDPANVQAAIQTNIKRIFSETPAKPTLTFNDIEAISKIAHANEPRIVHVFDATFATPVMLQPIDLGADVTLHSTTKYYDGHKMTVGRVGACATEEHHK